MLLVAQLMVRAALRREESRGVHLRTDFPETDNQQWQTASWSADASERLPAKRGKIMLTELAESDRPYFTLLRIQAALLALAGERVGHCRSISTSASRPPWGLGLPGNPT